MEPISLSREEEGARYQMFIGFSGGPTSAGRDKDRPLRLNPTLALIEGLPSVMGIIHNICHDYESTKKKLQSKVRWQLY